MYAFHVACWASGRLLDGLKLVAREGLGVGKGRTGLPGSPTTVDGEVLSGHVAAGVARQENDSAL